MKRAASAVPGLFLLFLCLFLDPAQAGSIFNNYEHQDGTFRPSLTREFDRVILGHRSQRTVLSFRLSLYGRAGRNLPLLVQVHEWGGSFTREEDLASYVPRPYNFVMLYFQYKPSTGNEDDWWFGTHWGGLCRMWAHQAVMNIVRQAASGSLVSQNLSGVTIDPQRVYLFGHSIGGTGAWQLGVRNPDVFAAVHAHAGFARFTPPVGPFQGPFEQDIVGRQGQGVRIQAPNGRSYSARDYSNLAWWLTNYRRPGWETPFISFSHGLADDTVPAASGGDLMRPVMDSQKRGFFYYRHSGGHSDACFVQMNWLWNFRRNQSFLAFTNRQGYGLAPDRTVDPWRMGGVNNLYAHGWDPASIVDRSDLYQVRLTGVGRADVTPRRLQRFRVTAQGRYRYWLNQRQGAGTAIRADQSGLLTVPGVPGGRLLIIAPET